MMSGLPLSKGNRSINISLRVPDADVAYVDQFFADHKEFMDLTHPTSGDDEPRPLMYIVTKSPEPNDSNDPAFGSSGNMLYSLTETFRGTRGYEAHMVTLMLPYGRDTAMTSDERAARRELHSTFRDVVGKYAVFQSMRAEVVYTMKDPLRWALANVRPGCRAFNFCFKVPNADVAYVDNFFADHKAFMDRTHPTSGDVEPMVLYYTVTKTHEPKDLDAPFRDIGESTNTLYTLNEIFRGMKGCEAHMAAGQSAGPFFAQVLDVVDKYAVHQSMTAEVVHTMK
jgi:hypothetical protein